jgi:hypothetical protein
LYGIGFQGPFQLQVNPAAARAGALWQTFIRRAVHVRFQGRHSVVHVYGTFVDHVFGSCGEIRDWVQGRTWRLEVDDRLDLLRLWRRGRPVDEHLLGSPEYRAKRRFMHDFVALLHEMGAHEFARQYEWSTCKSQPNCLKRHDTEHDPTSGLVAVDFQAGLVLLPFLPMSPGDFKLIVKGLQRGSWVQFDRGDPARLEAFVQAHAEHFQDMTGMLEALKDNERIYRDSLPDVTHNRLRLLYDRRLWHTLCDSAVTGWRVRGLIDDSFETVLHRSRIRMLLFVCLGVIPWLGRVLRKFWGHSDWRRHYLGLFRPAYLKHAFWARVAERVTVWHRAGRISELQARRIATSIPKFLGHKVLSLIPLAGLHRFLSDGVYRKERFHYLFIRPFQLYFHAPLREQWMRDMVEDGRKKHMLTDEDANTILSQLREPYIQKYLVSLVVHLMTLPVTQIVSLTVAGIFYFMHPDMDPVERGVKVGAILVLFQVIPISPGSLCRGLYVVYCVIRDRDFKNYNIAVFLGFFKYVGYLAFPIQMTYHYPALARFMAGHWATEAVHMVPVFGERGALLEHGVFNLFYNWPLTLRRRMQRRADKRAFIRSRYWHIPLIVLGASAAFGVMDWIYLGRMGEPPHLKAIWVLVVLLLPACGALVTYGAGGACLGRRIMGAAVAGLFSAAMHTGLTVYSANRLQAGSWAWITPAIWRVFIFVILFTIGALITEIFMPEVQGNSG